MSFYFWLHSWNIHYYISFDIICFHLYNILTSWQNHSVLWCSNIFCTQENNLVYPTKMSQQATSLLLQNEWSWILNGLEDLHFFCKACIAVQTVPVVIFFVWGGKWLLHYLFLNSHSISNFSLTLFIELSFWQYNPEYLKSLSNFYKYTSPRILIYKYDRETWVFWLCFPSGARLHYSSIILKLENNVAMFLNCSLPLQGKPSEMPNIYSSTLSLTGWF